MACLSLAMSRTEFKLATSLTTDVDAILEFGASEDVNGISFTVHFQFPALIIDVWAISVKMMLTYICYTNTEPQHRSTHQLGHRHLALARDADPKGVSA